MLRTKDAFGAELWDYYKTKEGKRVIVERDDHYIDGSRRGYGSDVCFSTYKDWSTVEKKAIQYARGRVLDVGCGAGRHALYLQKKGLAVTGIDASPLAIKICKLRGVKNAKVLSFDQIGIFKDNSFDTVILMGNNFGLFGGFHKAKKLLRKLQRVTSEKGLIIATTTDPYKTDNPAHRSYQRLNRKRGRMPGQLRIRIRHGNLIGPWFDYLLASKKEVEEIVAGTGWKIKKVIESKGPSYALVIEKQITCRYGERSG
jgi:SAM-dependent methyltransferase